MKIYITWGHLAGDVSQSLIPLPGEQRSSGNPLQSRLGDPAQIPQRQFHSINPKAVPMSVSIFPINQRR